MTEKPASTRRSTSKPPNIDITTTINLQQTDEGAVGQTVRMRAELTNLQYDPETHRLEWRLHEGATPLPGEELLDQGDPQVLERFWTIPASALGTKEIGLDIFERDGTEPLASERVLFTTTAPHAFAQAAPGPQGPTSTGRPGRFSAIYDAARMVEASANAYNAVRRGRSDDGDRTRTIDGSISLRRTASIPTDDIALWVLINKGTEALSFNQYQRAMDRLLCGIDDDSTDDAELERQRAFQLGRFRSLPFNDTDAYRYLKVATEAFVLANVGAQLDDFSITPEDIALVERRLGIRGDSVPPGYFVSETVGDDEVTTLPYLALVLRNLGETRLKRSMFAAIEHQVARLLGTDALKGRRSLLETIEEFEGERCYGVLEEKLNAPIMLELIWSYWQEEGMLVQTMNAITRRFQNVRAPGDRDPLAAMEIDPLRPLNNVLWGYLQDEQHRLSIPRRAYEYDHHYGISLFGKAVPALRPADSRSKFIEAFHSLLGTVSSFYHQDDDTTVFPDAFPVLNAIREVHLILSQGAHNQFGDLPSTARQEMMIQQWLLARPEFREFLPTRAMVAYPEAWMHRVEAMKTLQQWTDTSSMHFNSLAVFGEKLFLSLRYGAWTTVNDPLQASNWARFWRPEIQGYIHAYRAVTGVDLASDVVDTRAAQDRWVQPAIHLRKRMEQQQRGIASGAESLSRSVPAASATVRRG